VSGQTEPDGISDRTISIKADKAPPALVFHQLIYDLGIPIGLEISKLDDDTNELIFETNLPVYRQKKGNDTEATSKSSISYEVRWGRTFSAQKHFITLDFENTSIKRVLDSFVKQLGHYRWEISNGAVNIYPKEGRDQRLMDIQELEVKDFVIGPKAPLIVIQPALYGLPEIEAFLRDRNLAVSEIRRNAQDLRRLVPREAHYSKIKLRQILNNLARLKGGGWVLRIKRSRNVDDEEMIEIDI
jgi:hypothetical protein